MTLGGVTKVDDSCFDRQVWGSIAMDTKPRSLATCASQEQPPPCSALLRCRAEYNDKNEQMKTLNAQQFQQAATTAFTLHRSQVWCRWPASCLLPCI